MKRDNSAITPSQLEPLMIDSRAASVMLGMGARRLWSLTNCGAIPSRKIGRSVRYVPSELRAWIAAGCPTETGAGEQFEGGDER